MPTESETRTDDTEAASARGLWWLIGGLFFCFPIGMPMRRLAVAG